MASPCGSGHPGDPGHQSATLAAPTAAATATRDEAGEAAPRGPPHPAGSPKDAGQAGTGQAQDRHRTGTGQARAENYPHVAPASGFGTARGAIARGSVINMDINRAAPKNPELHLGVLSRHHNHPHSGPCTGAPSGMTSHSRLAATPPSPGPAWTRHPAKRIR